MKKYIELKIRKKYFIICLIVIALLSGIGGYYIWGSYHPIIDISIVEGGKGDNLKIQSLSVIVSPRSNEVPSYVELNLLKFGKQYNDMNEYLINNLKTGNVKLDVKFENKQVILKYSGTGTNLNDESIEINREIVCDFPFDVNIKE